MSEYARAGVDYAKIEPFKRKMQEVGKMSLHFSEKRGVYVRQGVHGALFEYRGDDSHMWCQTQEGLGNKNWIAEWMYKRTGKTYYDQIARDTILMAVNDLVAQGALPVVYTDEVAAGDSEWFADEKRARDFARGCYELCKELGMALPAGESPSLRYLVRAKKPVGSAPVLSGCATGIIAPSSRCISGEKLRVGDRIIGAASSGVHANGISLIIEKALELPDKFLTEVFPGKTLGEEVLTSSRSYAGLVEALLDEGVEVHKFLPSTGSGVAKLMANKRAFAYHIFDWPKVPPIFWFLFGRGISVEGCLRTFNWGVGYYIFVPEHEVTRAMLAGEEAGYELYEIGRVEKGPRRVIFEPQNIVLTP